MIGFNAIHAEITWTLSDDGTLTISGTNMPNYSWDNLPWNSQKDAIKKVIIENGVKNIGNCAFSNCSNLASVTIPNTVTKIGSAAFYKCIGLISVTIPESVTKIDSQTFYGCWCLASVNIPKSVTNIGYYAFGYCVELTSINIPKSVTNIGEYAFSDCSGLTSITIPSSVTSIGNGAFQRCASLTSITIPNSVTTIGVGAFNGTNWYNNQPDGLVYIGQFLYKYKGTMPANTNIVIKEGTKGIGGSVFSGCSGLVSITIPNSVTSIGEYAFSGCSGLTSITIPESITTIEDYTFQNCSSLASVIIPNSVTRIGAKTFEGTKWYEDQPDGLVYAGLLLYKYKGYMPANAKIVIKEGTTGIVSGAFYGYSFLTSVTIPNSVRYIGSAAFRECSHLTSVTIPSSMMSIEGVAFANCNNLASITFPNSLTNIGENAFDGTIWYGNQPDGLVYAGSVLYEYKGAMPANTKVEIKEGTKGIAESAFNYCSNNLVSVTIPNSMMNIGKMAFDGCSGLTSITIPSSVTSIGYLAFSYCSGLTSIISESTTPPNCDIYSFLDVEPSIPVYVPYNCIDTYKKAEVWNSFTNIQAIPSTYTIVDGETYTNDSQREICDISYIRKFSNTKWQALYIPFSLSYDDWKDDFDVAYINGIRQLDKNDDGIIDETIMDVIKIKSGSTTPNMPYLIKAKTTGEKTLSVSNATLYPAEENSVDCSTTIAKYTFTGTYNAIPSATMIANKFYAMGGGELIQSDGSNDLKPYRWYMKVESRNSSYNASNAAKTITINVIDKEGETTSVEELQMTNYKSPVYDLNGRKVNENNLKPGIYVKNGKKFVVK